MTKHENFKKRVRARMAKTGERYGAARRSLIAEPHADVDGSARPWINEPEFTDDVVRRHTGRGWDEWRDLIEAWPGHHEGHAAVAAHLAAEYGLNGWWSQAVTVSWERISGRRVVNQRADGTFEAGKTRTVRIDHDVLRAALYDDEVRTDLFPGLATEMRSKPTTKVPRVAFPEGVALFTLTELDDGRVRVNVSHGQLASPADVDHWKAYWAEWLDAIDEAAVHVV
jgi:hypothetical protein